MDTAEEILELARRGLGDLATYERQGADLVGTDDYPALRGAWKELVAKVERGAPEAQIAAAYALAFVLEHADDTLPVIDRVAEAATDPIVRAGLRLASARLGASVAVMRGRAPQVPWEGITLDARAESRSAIERAIVALGQVFQLPSFPRKVQPEIAEALDAIGDDVAVGPWGGGSLRALIQPLRKTLWVQEPPKPAVVTPPAPDHDIGDDPVADPYTQQRPERGAPRVTLAGLRDVDWAALEHAYGDASGVPGMIDGLSSPREEDRAWAIDALDASIHHQGSVYSASTAAVPFLVRLAEEPGLEGRAKILVLLCGIAVHQPEGCLAKGARQWRSEAYAAVVAGGPAYVRLLADPDPEVRTAAAFVLAYVDPPPPGALAALRDAMASERDRRARASQMLALGYVGRYLEDRDDVARMTARLDDDAPLLRGAAALALFQLLGQDAPAAARDVLARLPDETPRIRGFFPWANGDLGDFARTIRLAFQSDDELWASVGGADPDVAMRAAGKLFGSLFFDDVHGPERPWIPAELDEPRRKLLRFYVDITKDQEHGFTLVPFWEVACDAGLYSAKPSIARLIGDSPGPLDRELTIGGDTRPIAAWLIAATCGKVAPADVVAAAAAWPLEDRTAVVDDAFAYGYAVTAPRWHTAYGEGDDHPHSPDRHNDYTSRALLLLADLVDGAVAWARAHADAQIAKADKRDARVGVVAALVLARAGSADPAIDALCRFDQAPATTYRQALRVLLGQLPADRVEQIVLTQPLYGYQAYVDARGEVRRWVACGGWQVIDCAPPAVIVREVLAAARDYQRHRTAGDDRAATPVIGTTTTNIEAKPGPDGVFPWERAEALLRGCGELAADALAELSRSRPSA